MNTTQLAKPLETNGFKQKKPMKVAYIAHPIAGNVIGNLERIRHIVRDINLNQPDVVPLVPYYADCLALDDTNPDERQRGLRNGIAVLSSGMVHELWLYGNTISKGMSHEIIAAKLKGITIVPKTHETNAEYNKHFAYIQPAKNDTRI